MYTTILSIFSGATFFYLGYNYTDYQRQLQKPVKQLRRLPNHTYFPSTVGQYTELQKENNKYHQCPLSTHELINKQTIAADQHSKNNKSSTIQEQLVTDSQSPGKIDPKVEQKSEEPPVPTNDKKNKALFQRIYKDYAGQLINNNTCNSVQLIYGPVFSKDTPYKTNGEVVKNVYASNIKVSKDGQWLTDRYYTLVVCNRNEGSYFNAFTHRKSSYPTFRFLNYLTSLKKLEEQTGLVFNVTGEQLTRVDYAGISKERTFEAQEQLNKSTKQEESNER